MGIFSKLKQAWFGDVNWEKLDDEFFDNLEESLILAVQPFCSRQFCRTSSRGISFCW